jgi:haloacid dehalogenase-like hydrolase
MGITTAVFSGDGAPAVRRVAAELGIDQVEAELSPSQKLDAIRELQQAQHKVVMVGDGVNDAPALSAADVGCAIGSGTDAAISSSEVALLRDDLHGVPAAVALARATLAVIHQNFGWAMGYNIAAIPLAAAGLLDPLIAALTMGCSSLVVVLNSLRLARIGRSGTVGVKAPRVFGGVRGFALSIALPVVLFAGGTTIGQVVSPARGQCLLGCLVTVSTVNLPGGAQAEVYLGDSSPGFDPFHLVVTEDGNPVAPASVATVAIGPGGVAERVPLTPVGGGPGHYIGYVRLSAGSWRFAVDVKVAGHDDQFSVQRQIG